MADTPCHLCAGKCRGHSLGNPGAWEPEPGSAAALEVEIYDAWETACRANNHFANHDTSSIFGAGYCAALKAYTAIPTLLEALREFVGAVDAGTTFADQSVVEAARAAITLATGKDA